jgi:hypothetical protein
VEFSPGGTGTYGSSTVIPVLTVDTYGRITGASGASFTATSQWTTSGSDIYYSTGKVGVGQTTPQGKLDILGTSGITGLYVYHPTSNNSNTVAYFGSARSYSHILDIAADGIMTYALADQGSVFNSGSIKLYGAAYSAVAMNFVAYNNYYGSIDVVSQSATVAPIGSPFNLVLQSSGGRVSIGTTNSSAPLHIRGIVAGGINAYNYYNYTFPQAGVYTVILEYAQFGDTNICDGWNVTVGTGNNPTIYKISGNGAYLRTNIVSQYVVGFGSANSLPAGFNTSNYNLRIALLCAQ